MAEARTHLTDISWYPQSLQVNHIPEIMPGPRPTKSIPLHCSLIILPFGRMQNEFLRASLNKLQSK
jgi:hypothetical protein